MSCEAVIFWRVEDPRNSGPRGGQLQRGLFQAANSALKDTIGSLELSELLGEREMLSSQLKVIIDSAASRFGVDVSSVEITDIHVPEDLIQELSVLAQSRAQRRPSWPRPTWSGRSPKSFSRLQEAMGSSAMELYRLNVLERIGREEGSQIVIYGLNGGQAAFEENLAANAAGALVRRPAAERPPADRSQPSAPPPVFEP